jgi:hypothetical protein
MINKNRGNYLMSNQPPNNEPWRQPPNTSYPPQQPYPGNQPYPPQQSYPGNQPYPPQPMYSPPPKKKNRTWLWIVLGVVGVLVLGCIGVSALVFNAAQSTTTTTATISTLATDVATTTSNTPAPSNTQHFAVGQVVKVGDTWNVTVNSAKTSKGSGFSTPQKAGDVFLVFSITVKNLSSQEQTISSALSFNLLDSTGQKYTETIYPDAGATLDGKVAAGSLLKGSIVYEVPASMHQFTLSFEPDITSPGQTIWDIHS